MFWPGSLHLHLKLLLIAKSHLLLFSWFLIECFIYSLFFSASHSLFLWFCIFLSWCWVWFSFSLCSCSVSECCTAVCFHYGFHESFAYHVGLPSVFLGGLVWEDAFTQFVLPCEGLGVFLPFSRMASLHVLFF